jgi:prephenate dehydratase
MALAQCRKNIEALGLTPEPAINTAAAAQMLSDRTQGALASEHAATAYHLHILRRDMQDEENNETTFIVLAR